MKRFLLPLFAVLAAVGFAVTIWGVFVVTPMERELFYSQKIFYYHVPNAFMLFFSVFVCGVASIGYLKSRDPRWDDVAMAGGELAALFGAVVLVTGSIWARAAWGHWWVWENRLTMSLILWCVMLGYALVRRFGGPGAERLAAGMAIFGSVGIPFIYVGVKQGDSHPKAGVVQTLDPSMKLTFWLSVLTFFFVFLALLWTRVASARAERELRELRERALDHGLFA
jgi:heme exporter protein C